MTHTWCFGTRKPPGPRQRNCPRLLLLGYKPAVNLPSPSLFRQGLILDRQLVLTLKPVSPAARASLTPCVKARPGCRRWLPIHTAGRSIRWCARCVAEASSFLSPHRTVASTAPGASLVGVECRRQPTLVCAAEREHATNGSTSALAGHSADSRSAGSSAKRGPVGLAPGWL
jgi:hypothetical protein